MSSGAVRGVRVEVPATTANLGAGFDVLGLALDITNVLEFSLSDTPGVEVHIHGPGADRLPRDSSHLAVQAAWRFYEESGLPRPEGLKVRQRLGVPLAGGLGSSATAVVGGILAGGLVGADWSMEHVLGGLRNRRSSGQRGAGAARRPGQTVRENREGVYRAVPVNEAWSPAAVLAVPDFS